MTTLANAVVLVAASPGLSITVKHAVLEASGGLVIVCDLSSMTTVAAESRPYAIVVPRDVYEFGRSEFDALARDLDTGLVVVPEGVRLAVVSAMLSEEAMRLG